MGEFDPDLLFRRFREQRDIGALGELFDRAAPQLARVAWHLVHDAGEVEDLVQATFLSALDSADKFDAGRPVLPWLLGILANHAHNARRAERRRPVALASEVADPREPRDELERRELHEAVERAVAELPETYRQVVSTWLLEGASPGEIAARTGKPGATVRVQLHRGLELLRHGLPASVAALCASSGWSQGSTAGVRAAVLARASEVARTLVPTSVVIGGGLLMGTKLWFATAAVFAATTVGVWWLARDVAEPAALASAPLVEAHDVVPPREPEPAPPLVARNEVAPAAAASKGEVAAAVPPPGWWLVGTVDGDVGSDPARLSSRPDEAWSFDVIGPRFEVDLTSLFADRAKAPKSLVVRYDHPRFVPSFARVEVAAQVDVDAAYASERVELHAPFELRPAALIVTGTIEVPAECEPSQACALLYSRGSDGRFDMEPTEQCRCEADGSFRLRSTREGAHALGVALWRWRPATRMIGADARGSIDLGAIRLERGEHLAGWTASDGRAASVYARLVAVGQYLAPTFSADASLTWVRDRFEWRSVSAQSDERGAFRLEGLAPVEYRIDRSLLVHSAHSSVRATVSLLTATDDPVFLASCDGLSLELDCCRILLDVRADGAPLRGATVRANYEGDTFDSSTTLKEEHLFGVFWDRPRSVRLRVSKEGMTPQEFAVGPDEAQTDSVRVVELSRDPTLAALTLRPVVSCSDSSGRYTVFLAPLEVAPAAAQTGRPTSGSMSTSRGLPARTFTLTQPEWRLVGIPAGRYRVLVHRLPPETEAHDCVPTPIDVQLAAGESAVRELMFEAGGHLSLSVLNAHGAAEWFSIKTDDLELRIWRFLNPRSGKLEEQLRRDVSAPLGAHVELLTPLASGHHSLTVTLDDEQKSRREVPFEIVAGRTTELVIDFSKPDQR